MARHMERAENTARLLKAQHQAFILSQPELSSQQQWSAVIELFELEAHYKSSRKIFGQANVLEFMVVDDTNESSIYSCLKRARENARANRSSIPTELWEMINTAWLDFGNIFKTKNWIRDLDNSLEWVKQQSHLFRGVLEGTMPRNESLYFTKIGMFLERADNTARILDINFLLNYTTANKINDGTSGNMSLFRELSDFRDSLSKDKSKDDYYFWVSVLRSLSAFEIYRQVYRDEITPLKVAELLIYRGDMPRSLFVCVRNIQKNLERVSSIENYESSRIVGKLCAEIQYESINNNFVIHIHEFLTSFLERINYLGLMISNEFLVPIATVEGGLNSSYRVVDE